MTCLKNCSADLNEVPTTEKYLACLNGSDIAILCISGVFTLFANVIFLEELLFFARKMGYWKPKDKALKLLSLYPVIANASFISIIVPRSATLNDIVILMYLAMCVYIFVVMLMGHFGGLHKMATRLDGNVVSTAVPPLCCCCTCLPSFTVDTMSLQLMELAVFQWVIIRPVLAYVAAVLWTNQSYENMFDPTSTSTWLNFLNILSTFIALYGFTLVYKLSRQTLTRMTIKPKFLVIQLVITVTTFQPIIFSSFAAAGVFPCTATLSRTANAARWNHFLYTVEAVFVSIVARFYYRRHVGDEELGPEDKAFVEQSDVGTSTTRTLTRQISGIPVSQQGPGVDGPDSHRSAVTLPYGRSAGVYQYGTLSSPDNSERRQADFGIFNPLVRREKRRKARKSGSAKGVAGERHTIGTAPDHSPVAVTDQAVGPEQVVVDVSTLTAAQSAAARHAQHQRHSLPGLETRSGLTISFQSNDGHVNFNSESANSNRPAMAHAATGPVEKTPFTVFPSEAEPGFSGSTSPMSLTGSGMIAPSHISTKSHPDLTTLYSGKPQVPARPGVQRLEQSQQTNRKAIPPHQNNRPELQQPLVAPQTNTTSEYGSLHKNSYQQASPGPGGASSVNVPEDKLKIKKSSPHPAGDNNANVGLLASRNGTGSQV